MASIEHNDNVLLCGDCDLFDKSTNDQHQTRLSAMSYESRSGSASPTISRRECMFFTLAAVVAIFLLVILMGVQLHYIKKLDRKTDLFSVDNFNTGTSMSGNGGRKDPNPSRQTGDGGQDRTPGSQTGDGGQDRTPGSQTGDGCEGNKTTGEESSGEGEDHTSRAPTGDQAQTTPSTPTSTEGRAVTPTNYQETTVVTTSRSVTECVVGAGSTNLEAGDPFNDNSTYITNGRITGLDVRVKGREVTGVRMRYGGQRTAWRGFFTGGNVNYIRLTADELITSLTMHVGHHDGFLGVTGLDLETSQGRSFTYGSTSRSYTVGFWDELLYISGRAGGLIDRLNVHARGCNDG